MNFLFRLFSSDGFLPHGHCYLWDPLMMWLNIISDALITLAYLTIPVTLICIVRKRKDLPFDWMWFCFGVFILACGTTHGLEIWTLWTPTYWLLGWTKAVTAAASVTTAILLVKLIPQLLAIPSSASLKKVNKALQESLAALEDAANRLQLATEVAGTGVWDWDLRTDRIVWDKQMFTLYGLEHGDVTYDTWAGAVLPEDFSEQAAILKETAQTGGRSERQFRIRRLSDGAVRTIYSSEMAVKADDGGTLRVVGVNRDITEQLRIEQELKEAKVAAALREGAQRYSFLADTMPLIVWTARPDGHRDYYNKRWLEYTGLSLAESRERSWGPVAHPDDVQLIFERWENAVKTGGDFEFEFRLRRASDRSYRWHLSRAEAMRDDQGKIVQWVGTTTDIDESKSTEIALQQAKEAAESASRSKSEFLANMSHEIRTPMNGILGLTELVLETEIGSAQREYLDMVQISGRQLLGLVNDILDFSKIEAGKLELEAIPFSLRDCVNAVLTPISIRAQTKGLKTHTDIAIDVPEQVIGDSMRLRQILLNLADNSLKFTQRGSVLVRVTSEAQRGGEQCLHFSIKDSGMGIPPEKQKAIFQAFTQVDGSTSRTFGGTGLGLAIASRLVEKMRGEIWVTSTEGLGATFHFTAWFPVPENLSPISRIVPGKVSKANGPFLRILLAEDNAINRALVMGILAEPGHSIVQAANGFEALTCARAETFDLILMDVQMPEMDGFEATRCIRAEESLRRHTPIVATTSYALVGDRERCLAAGMDDYLSKPLDKAALLAIVERVSSPLTALRRAPKNEPAHILVKSATDI
jgi:PAS domain S-box-containing protein